MINPILDGAIASLGAGLATAVGALPILFLRTINERVQGIMLGFGGGVMLAASSFSLIVPGTEAAIAQGSSRLEAAAIVATGMLIGVLFLELMHRFLPHEHFFKGKEGADTLKLRRIWLFVIAIALHNFPEGLAVGVGFGATETQSGLALATGIGLQNMPEGLVVAFSLLGQGYAVLFCLWISLLTGLVEPIGGAIGAGIVSVVQPILPWGMAFAAGAMLFVIADEIIPESHRQGIEREGAFGVIGGFLVMMVLDTVLG